MCNSKPKQRVFVVCGGYTDGVFFSAIYTTIKKDYCKKSIFRGRKLKISIINTVTYIIYHNIPVLYEEQKKNNTERFMFYAQFLYVK